MKAFDLGFSSGFGIPARGTGEPTDYVYLAEIYPWHGSSGVTYGTAHPYDVYAADTLPDGEDQPPGAVVPLYQSDRTYLTPRDDVEAPRRLYGGRLQGFSVERRIPISPADGARAAATYGTLTLRNDDGVLDALPDSYAIANRRVVVRRLIRGEYLAHAVTIFDGVGVAWEPGRSVMSITVRDKTALAELPLLPLYSGGGGKSGPAEWAGRPMPGYFGINRWVPLTFYDTVYGLARVHFRRVHGVPALWDKGGAYTLVGDYATEAALKAASLTGGQYATCTAEGLVRAVPAGLQFAGQVTCDIEGDAEGGYVDTHAGIARRILDIAGLSSIVDATYFDALAATYPGAAGFGWTDQRTYADAVTEVLGGISAWWSDDRDGYVVCGRLDAPPDETDVEFTKSDIIDLEPTPIPSSVSPAVWRVTVNYQRCRSVTNRNQLLDTADEAVKAFAEKEWRTSTPSEDTTVLVRYPAAPALVINSGFDSKADADALAAYLLLLYKPGRVAFAQKVPLAVATALYPGKTMRLTWPRHNLQAGRSLVVTALPEDISDRTATVIAWG